MPRQFTLTPSEESRVRTLRQGDEFLLIRPYQVPQADVRAAEVVELLGNDGRTVLVEALAQQCTQTIPHKALSRSEYHSAFFLRAKQLFESLGLSEDFPDDDDDVLQTLGVTHLRVAHVLHQSPGGESAEES